MVLGGRLPGRVDRCQGDFFSPDESQGQKRLNAKAYQAFSILTSGLIRYKIVPTPDARKTLVAGIGAT